MKKDTILFLARCQRAIDTRDEAEIRLCLALAETQGGKSRTISARLNKALAARHKR